MNQKVHPDPAIARELFLKWRSPRFGNANPERMNNPIWDWLIRSEISAYSANQEFEGSDPRETGPGWCFMRNGQSSTPLPDGRNVLIAGEHEDYYDSDFHIYNDVVVRHPDGRIDVFGYPKEVFPPTDFHTATLVGNRIIIIGSVGYPAERKPGFTPIFSLNLQDFAISQLNTCGTPPGWIFEHNATLSEDGASILIRGGKVVWGVENRSLVENINDWRLYLGEMRWERTTDRLWRQLEIRRKDRKRNRLWKIRQACWSRRLGWKEKLQKQLEELRQELGIEPDLDLVADLYRPKIAHESIPEVEDKHNVFRIKVNGVIVRYVRDLASIQLTVEGELSENTIGALTADLLAKLTLLENTSYESRIL